jgi:hypothetical protein
MKTSIYLIGILVVTGIISLNSCKTSSVGVQVLNPAEITLPSKIKKVAIANRSLPDKGEKAGNIVEGLLSGEGFQQDREASEKAILGFVDVIVSSPRFEVVRPTNIDLRGTGTAAWPIPLNWEEVEKICAENKADALITLETFDSDNIRRSAVEKKTKKVNDKTVEYDLFIEHLDVYVTCGWRVYDPQTKTIIDQRSFRDMKGFSADDPDPKRAVSKLPHKRAATNDAGFFAGTLYAARISPVWVNVSRSYYTKGHDDFKKAKAMVRTNNWKQASEIWLKHADSSDPKIKARACYNLALANEIEGNLGDALKWAEKAHQTQGKSMHRMYVNTIHSRIQDAKRLDEQMKDVE